MSKYYVSHTTATPSGIGCKSFHVPARLLTSAELPAMLKVKEKMKKERKRNGIDRKDEKRKQREAVKEKKAEEQIKNANEQVKKAEIKAQKAAGKTGCEEKGC